MGGGGGWGDGATGGCAVVVAVGVVGVVAWVPGSAWAGETGCFLAAGVRDTRVSGCATGSAGRIAVAAAAGVVGDGVFSVGTARSVAAAVVGLVVGTAWLDAAVVVVEEGVQSVRAAHPCILTIVVVSCHHPEAG